MMNHLNLKTNRDTADLQTMEKKAVGRTEYLEMLVHYHDAGLLFCWKIKEGLKRGVDPERVNRYINFFWNRHLKDHFKEKEILLFDKVDCDLTRQGKNEHQQLSGWFNLIINEGLKSFKEYFSFTDLFVNHIRFEERVLLPYLESELAGESLDAVGKALPKHRTPFIDNYDDEFWLRKENEMAI